MLASFARVSPCNPLLKKLVPLLVMGSLLSILSNTAAGDDTAKAIRLINEMEDLYRGDASLGKMTMIVKTPQFERTMTMSSANQGEEKSFIRILSPRKDRGIATLKLDDEMWNYFPKINKVIKVPPSMMMGSWMGSDFTNDDLVKQTTLTEEYDLDLQETEERYVIELTPKAQTVTVWGKIDYVIEKQRMLPLEQNFYDDNGEMIRKLRFMEPKAYSGKLLPSRLEMLPLNKEGHMTIVLYDELQFDPPEVDDKLFTLRNLKSRF